MKYRIYLRALKPEDYLVSVKWRNDPEIQSMVGGHCYYVSEEKEKEWVLNTIHNETRIVLAICLVENDKYIGNVILQDIDYIDGSASVPIMIGDKDEWGKGYGTEARFLALNYAFNERRLHRITDLVKEDNIRSIRLHEKCGYRVEGILRQSIFRNGTYHNQVIMGLLKDDFDKSYNDYIKNHS